MNVLSFVLSGDVMPLLHSLFAQEAEELFKENVVSQTVSQTMFDREGRFACLSS